jgi:hypothetical protein
MEKTREDNKKGWEDWLKCKPSTYEKLGFFIYATWLKTISSINLIF